MSHGEIGSLILVSAVKCRYYCCDRFLETVNTCFADYCLNMPTGAVLRHFGLMLFLEYFFVEFQILIN
jgi:hypothetical protein